METKSRLANSMIFAAKIMAAHSNVALISQANNCPIWATVYKGLQSQFSYPLMLGQQLRKKRVWVEVATGMNAYKANARC